MDGRRKMYRLSDEYAVKPTGVGFHIFARIQDIGEIIKDPYAGSVTLDEASAWEFVKYLTDGSCPVCGHDINQGETVCDSCFAQAKGYRDLHGGGE
jgi:hypothetical protein